MIPKLILLPHHKKLFDKLSQIEKAEMLDALMQYINLQEVTPFENPVMDMLFTILTADVKTEDGRKYSSRENGKKHTSNLNKKIGSNVDLASISQNPLIDNKNIIKEENIIQDNNIRDNNNLSDDKYIIPKKEKEINKEKSPTGDTKKADKDKVDFDKFAEYYNAAMQHRAIKPISRITDRRKENLTARTREFGKEALQTVVDKAAASDFLNGKNNKGWVADFDWIMRPNNFPKVLEGNYDNDKVMVISDSVDPDVKDGTKLRQSEMDYTKGLW